MRIHITAGSNPADQLRAQVKGLVSTGQLAAGERLPSVRRLAADLGIAPATVAKAYRLLEAEGIIASRIGAGTRVAETAAASPLAVVDAARSLVDACRENMVSLDDALAILRSTWRA